MDVSALHQTIGRASAIGTSIQRDNRSRAVQAFAAAEMYFIAFDGGAGGAIDTADQRGGFVAAHGRRDIEQSQPVDRPGAAVDAIRIGNSLAEHLIAAAEPENTATAADMGLDVDVPALCAQEGEIGDGGFAAGQDNNLGI